MAARPRLSATPVVPPAITEPTAAPERISLAPEDTSPASPFRTFVSDEPKGFEEMANDALVAEFGPATEPVALPLIPPPTPPIEALETPAPQPEPSPVPSPFANEEGISHSLMQRTRLEQEAGRAGVARRQAEHDRSREITARENHKRLVEGATARNEDLSYSGGATR